MNYHINIENKKSIVETLKSHSVSLELNLFEALIIKQLLYKISSLDLVALLNKTGSYSGGKAHLLNWGSEINEYVNDSKFTIDDNVDLQSWSELHNEVFERLIK